MDDNVFVMSFKFSPNNYPYLRCLRSLNASCLYLLNVTEKARHYHLFKDESVAQSLVNFFPASLLLPHSIHIFVICSVQERPVELRKFLRRCWTFVSVDWKFMIDKRK